MAGVYLEPLGALRGVRAAPDVRSEPWRLSLDGGGQPKWRADGQELYFLTADGMMMRVIGFEGQEPGKAEPLFVRR